MFEFHQCPLHYVVCSPNYSKCHYHFTKFRITPEQTEQLAAGQIINKDMPRLDNRKYEVRGYHWDLMEDLQSDRPLQCSAQCVNKTLQAAPLN